MFVTAKVPAITAHDREYPHYVSLKPLSQANLSTWRAIPRALGLELSDYVKWLKARYGDRVDIRANHSYIYNRVSGLSISFKRAEDAQDLAQILNRR